MGVHWRWLDYGSLDAMVAEHAPVLKGRSELMLRFIEKSGLTDALEQADWRAFARGYNGPDYTKNDYDRKLAKAYETHGLALGDISASRRPDATARWY